MYIHGLLFCAQLWCSLIGAVKCQIDPTPGIRGGNMGLIDHWNGARAYVKLITASPQTILSRGHKRRGLAGMTRGLERSSTTWASFC